MRQKVKCFLCEKEAIRSDFKLGWRYQCDEHPWYGLNIGDHELLEIHFKTKPDDKEKFIDWLENNLPEEGDKFREIKRSDIEKILGIQLTQKKK